MYIEITECDFVDAFEQHGRKNQFSYEALLALYEYLESFEEDYNLDVIGLCCEFGEYTQEELVKGFGYLQYEEDGTIEKLLERLWDRTLVLEVEPIRAFHEKRYEKNSRYLVRHF